MNATQWKETKAAFANALELDADERVLALNSLSPEIREQVEKLLAAHEEADDFIEKPVVIDREEIDGSNLSHVPEQIDEYRIIEQIGVGGMGTVHLAEHSGEGFSHRVALKLIKRGMDTESVLKRFLMERQILSNLEHPNIARMIDGGSTLDGVPYFVMEFVDGEEIRRYCDAKHLGLNARLDLFQKVCSAVASAHQKLIVHRDLKPTNILVTRDGEPKLLDFGIAKLLSPDFGGEEATVTQFRVMTPEYASPEQIAGEPTSTSADIYSLGVILYELLTGQRPRPTKGKNPQQILESALTEEPPKPSSVVAERKSVSGGNTGESLTPETELVVPDRTKGVSIDPTLLRGDLDNIIMKAMRREPERRYQSVQEFSDDIRRYREGLPVNATADSRTYRFKKFFQRHRAPVLAGAAAAVVLIAATAITGWQYTVASRERSLAEKRFGDVRALANKVIFDYNDDLQTITGSTEVRKKMVADAMTYLDSLSLEDSDEPEFHRDLVRAYIRVGDIQGGMFMGSSLGDLKGAQATYEKGLEIAKKLSAGSPDNLDYQTVLATAHQKVGESYWATGKNEIAAEHLTTAIDLLKNVDANGALRDRSMLSDNYNRLTQVQLQSQQLDAALDTQKLGLAVSEQAVAESNRDKVILNDHAAAVATMGDIYIGKNLPNEAIPYYDQTLAIFDELQKIDPENSRVKGNISLILARRGIAALGIKDFAGTVKYCGESVRGLEDQLKNDPADATIAVNIATISSSLAVGYCGLKQTESCFATYKNAFKYFEAAFAASKDYHRANSNFIFLNLSYGRDLLKNGDKTQAQKYLETARDLGESLNAEGSENGTLAESYEALASIASGRSSLEMYRKSLDHLEKMKAANGLNGDYVEMYDRVQKAVAKVY